MLQEGAGHQVTGQGVADLGHVWGQGGQGLGPQYSPGARRGERDQDQHQEGRSTLVAGTVCAQVGQRLG